MSRIRQSSPHMYGRHSSVVLGVMTEDKDDKFYERADAHIHLSNDQIGDVTSGKVSASMMYATARFNAWLSACGFSDAKAMQDLRDENIEYFVDQYRKMLIENIDDYIDNFDSYMNTE